MLNSPGFGQLDENKFEDVYNYMLYLQRHNKRITHLIVNPGFYLKIRQSDLWQKIRMSEKDIYVYNKIALEDNVVNVVINSAMDGKWCILLSSNDIFN